MANVNLTDLNTAEKLAAVLTADHVTGTGRFVQRVSPTLTTPTINGQPTITPVSGTASYPVVCAGVSFTEAGDTTYTGTIEIPAGAILHNIFAVTTVLWDDTGAVTMVIGDDDDPNGWLEAASLKSGGDMVVGEVFSIIPHGTGTEASESWLGKKGAYLDNTSGKKGRVTAGVDSGLYYGAASEVIGVVTTANQDGTAGRSFMFVTYAQPTVVAATAA